MRIFISYASEYRNTAEEISVVLKGEGHEVFFDRSSLEPGDNYTSRIRAEVEKSDLMIFLISPESLDKDSYARTELNMAQEKWDHPDQGVLPVMVAPVSYKSLPPYLRTATVPELEGNVVANTTNRVAQRARERHRKRWIRGGVGVLAVGALLLWFLAIRPEPVEHVVCLVPGLNLDLPDLGTDPDTKYSLRFIHNADTFAVKEDVRNQLLCAGASREDLDHFLQRSTEDTVYADYVDYLTNLIPEADARRQVLEKIKRTRAILPTDRFMAGASIKVEIVRDSTRWKPSGIISTGTTDIRAGHRVTTIILEKNHGTD